MKVEELAMFPLEMVAFPGELIPLHIFEDRYQELIRDCENDQMRFGIPTYINGKMMYGTEVKLIQIVKRYDSGASDIICEGLRVFKLLDFYNTLGEKLYAGGTVSYLPNYKEASSELRATFIKLVKQFYKELGYQPVVNDYNEVDSYTLSHKIGLTLDEEYKLLYMTSETERYTFLISHLRNIIDTVMAVNRTKDIIKLNGHFKNFDALDFNEYKLDD